MTTVELQIPPRSVYVGVVRLAVASLARAAGLDEETVYDLKIAVSEACANAVLVSEEAGAEEPITIKFSDDGGVLALDILDRAPAPPATDSQDSQGFDSRAVMSLALLESLVDECSIAPRPDGGTRTHLSVNR